MPACQIHEIVGPDREETDSARPCIRPGDLDMVIGTHVYRVCLTHQGEHGDYWELFERNGRAYAVNPNATAPPAAR